jgi:IS66 C-terminal element
MLASLIESCKLHGVNPEAYLTDVLTKLVNNWPNSRLAELTPWAGLPRTDRRQQTKPARQAVQIVATAHRLRCTPNWRMSTSAAPHAFIRSHLSCGSGTQRACAVRLAR